MIIAMIGLCIGAGIILFILTTIFLGFLGISNPLISGAVTVLLLVLAVIWLRGAETIKGKDISDDKILYEMKIDPNSEKIEIKKIILNSDGKRPDETLTGWLKYRFGKSNVTEKCGFKAENQGIIRSGKNAYSCWYELTISGGEYDGKVLRYGIAEENRPKMKPFKEDEVWKISGFDGKFDEKFFGKLTASDVYIQFK